ncbi:hypothetical protein AUP68_07590 [Ilyonectria robusta]
MKEIRRISTPTPITFNRSLHPHFQTGNPPQFPQIHDVSLYGVHPSRREFYTGRPVWKLEDGKIYGSPWGHTRKVDPTHGAFFWTDTDGSTPLLDENGNQQLALERAIPMIGIQNGRGSAVA